MRTISLRSAQVFDEINQIFRKPHATIIAKRPEFIVATFRDSDQKSQKGMAGKMMNKMKGKKSEDEVPFYCIVLKRKPHALWPEDREFLEKLAFVAQETFSCVRGREYRKMARKTAIENINHITKKWAISSVKSMIQNSINELVTPLEKCDIYMGGTFIGVAAH